MKKLFFILPLLVLTTGCNLFKKDSSEEMNRLKAANDSLVLEQARQAAEFNEVISLLNEVESSFSSIRAAENYLTVQTNPETAVSETSKEKITKDIQFITDVLQQNKQKIATLERQVKQGRAKTTEMQRTITRLMEELQQKTAMIENLQAELAKKDIKIKELDEAVASLSQQLNEVEGVKSQQTQEIQAQDKALNEAYYVFGTAKELKQNNIVTREGLLKDSFVKDYFIKIDIRKVNIIPFYTKRAKILSSHPKDAYQLEESKEGIVLHILDSYKFWSISKYLVVQVK